MRKKEREADFYREIPDLVPEEARDLWPDLTRWPTVDDTRRFRKATKRRRDQRLAILSGLRSVSTADPNFIWSWLAIYLALIGIAVTTGFQNGEAWVAGVSCVIFLIGGGIVLLRLLRVAEVQEARARRARIWLIAIEDELRDRR